MTTSTLNFGALGRCGCGAVGKRRKRFGNEAICAGCLPERTGYLRATDWTSGYLMVGELTPAQRRARRQLLA